MSDQTAALLRQQDDELSVLGKGVQRVKALAGVMRDELHEQEVILEKLEEDVERADSALGSMGKKMRTMVEEAKSSDRALWTTIGCLSLLLAFLVYLVLQ
jgi:t-SNARE complex subunit (syntaxin)